MFRNLIENEGIDGNLLASLARRSYINQHLKFVFLYLLMTPAYFIQKKSYKKMEIEVNISLDNIANWLKANKLTLNVKKSSLLVFNSKNSKEKRPVKLFIYEAELEQKEFAKFN